MSGHHSHICEWRWHRIALRRITCCSGNWWPINSRLGCTLQPLAKWTTLGPTSSRASIEHSPWNFKEAKHLSNDHWLPTLHALHSRVKHNPWVSGTSYAYSSLKKPYHVHFNLSFLIYSCPEWNHIAWLCRGPHSTSLIDSQRQSMVPSMPKIPPKAKHVFDVVKYLMVLIKGCAHVLSFN